MKNTRKRLNNALFWSGFVFALVMSIAIIFPLTYSAHGKMEDWISYWGNVVGGILGAGATIFGVVFALKNDMENRRADHQKDEQRHFVDRFHDTLLLTDQLIDKLGEIIEGVGVVSDMKTLRNSFNYAAVRDIAVKIDGGTLSFCEKVYDVMYDQLKPFYKIENDGTIETNALAEAKIIAERWLGRLQSIMIDQRYMLIEKYKLYRVI